MNIVGVAEGGIPVDLAHNMEYVDGSTAWSGVLPAALVALSRAYGIDTTPYFTEKGQQVAATIATQCIGDFQAQDPALTVGELVKENPTQTPVFVHVLNNLIMGSAPGHPAGPLFMMVGGSDSTGDGVMITEDVEALAHEYCDQGVTVQFQTTNQDHNTTGAAFFALAEAFLAQRFLGTPATDTCSSVGTGNDLSPLAEPAAAAAPVAQPAVPAAPAAAGPAAVAAPAAAPELAATGLPAWFALSALTLTGSAAALRRRRSRTSHGTV